MHHVATRGKTLLVAVAVGAAATVLPASQTSPADAATEPLAVTDNIAAGATLSGSVTWTATVTAGSATKIEFLIDGAVRWTELWAPYQFNGDPGGRLAAASLANGTHTLAVRATSPAGTTATQSDVVGVGSAAPIPAPSATPTPAPTATPIPSGNPAFGSRPLSGPIVREGGSNVLIENVSIDGGGLSNPSGTGITIRNVNGTVTIRNVDLSDLLGGIYIFNSTGTLLIENVRGRNIGDGTTGSGHSNYIQLAESSFSGAVRGNRFLGGRTEDMISIWRSGGRGPGAELVIEGNRLQGLTADTSTARAWTSGSSTGTILGDGAGSPKNGNVIVRNNTYLTPGQVGLEFVDGPGLQGYGNIVFGEKRAQNNNSMTSWGGNPRGSVHDNRYCWTNNDGSQPLPWLVAIGSLTVTNNVRDCSIDIATLRVTFP